MNRLQHHGDESLDFLIKHAMGYAEFSMKNIGHVSPTFLVQTSDGILVYIPEMAKKWCNHYAAQVFYPANSWPA